MGDVFVLGAGFSKAVHNAMPDLRELSVEVRSKCKGSFALPPPLLALGDNIELWLTYLSQPQPWLKTYYNLQNHALFLYMTEVIGQVLDDTTSKALAQECPKWLRSLIDWWHERRSSVITFNYDTLIERAAQSGKIDMRNIYPVPLPDVRRVTTFEATHKDSFRLFKMHGSVNWYYSGAASFGGEVLYSAPVAPWGDRRDSEGESRLAASDKVPLIVPPTSEKTTYFQHETLRQIWLKAAAALGAATHVYCIGYSLPATDLGIRYFLLHSKTSVVSR